MNRTDAVRKAWEKAEELGSLSRTAAQRTGSQVSKFVQEKPVISTVLGLGLGFLVGRWFGSRD